MDRFTEKWEVWVVLNGVEYRGNAGWYLDEPAAKTAGEAAYLKCREMHPDQHVKVEVLKHSSQIVFQADSKKRPRVCTS
jgi:hypothetical protein